MDIDDIWRDMTSAVNKGLRIVVTRNVDNFALEQIMQKQQNFIASLLLFLFRVSFIVMVTVNNVATHETVVEVKRIGLDVLW